MATDTARSAQPLDHSRRRLTLVAMCIGQGMILLDNTIVNVALPAIQLVQQVAGGEGPAVAAAVGPGALAPAFDAFVAGYRVALLIAGLLLLLGAAVAATGLRAPGRAVETTGVLR